MPIKATPNESSYNLLEAGSYPTRLYTVIHIGRVPLERQGETKMIDKVRLTFEFPTETKVFKEEKGEQPYVLSCEFTLSMHEKASLRKFLEGWQGKRMSDMEAINTDIEEWIGREGLANVVHSEGKNGNTYANIQSISPLPKGLVCPPAVNPPFVLNYAEQWSQEKFDGLPDFIKEKIRQSDQYIAKYSNKNEAAGPSEEIHLEDIAF